jgi:hypothetical protein
MLSGIRERESDTVPVFCDESAILMGSLGFVVTVSKGEELI